MKNKYTPNNFEDELAAFQQSILENGTVTASKIRETKRRIDHRFTVRIADLTESREKISTEKVDALIKFQSYRNGIDEPITARTKRTDVNGKK